MDIEKIVTEAKANQVNSDIKLVLKILSFYSPKVILEIGMDKGGTMKIWSQAFQPDILIGIDIVKKPDVVIEIVRPNYHYLWDMNSNNLETVNKVKEILGDRKVDFLYIDGDHSRLACERDWLLYRDFVKVGGIVGIHDVLFHNRETEADIVWSNIKTLFPYSEIKTSHSSTGWGLVFV